MKFRPLAILAIIAILMIPLTSMALPASALSVRYFNSSGQVIGQQIRYCNGFAEHAGNVSSTNPYHVAETYGCKEPTSCTQVSTDYYVDCTPMVDNTYSIISFVAPDGLTQAEWCSGSTTYPWGASPSCGTPAPYEDEWALAGATWYPTWN
ncbi:hypothetical protein [Dyella sp. A6]|uniref:hypothetical protein n=1 Tax=Dyella aluminiiresistens TaxID=3069105 RepID=UPI002E78587E|nr:hypothetical protein [Dyella sp. A6]